MYGKIQVEFSEEEFDLIMKYMEATEAVTVQAAILNAISIALDGEKVIKTNINRPHRVMLGYDYALNAK